MKQKSFQRIRLIFLSPLGNVFFKHKLHKILLYLYLQEQKVVGQIYIYICVCVCILVVLYYCLRMFRHLYWETTQIWFLKSHQIIFLSLKWQHSCHSSSGSSKLLHEIYKSNTLNPSNTCFQSLIACIVRECRKSISNLSRQKFLKRCNPGNWVVSVCVLR